MGFLSNLGDKQLNQSSFIRELRGATNTTTVSTDRTTEITYNTCLRILSDSISKLPIELYKKDKSQKTEVETPLSYILNTQPNPYHNASIFWSTVEFNRNHHGNAYVWIETYTSSSKNFKKGEVKALWILPSEQIQVMESKLGTFKRDNGIYYIYTDKTTQTQYTIYGKEMLHFKTWITKDGTGIVGLAIKDILDSYIERNQYGNAFINNLTKGGMVSDKIILTSASQIGDEAEDAMISSLQRFSGKYLPLSSGVTAQNLSSKLTDNQFLDLSKYNSLQIGSAFGISPNFLNDYTKSSYANASAEQEGLYKNTLLSIFTQYEQELTIKLLSYEQRVDKQRFEYNTDILLRGNYSERIKAYGEAISGKIITTNEARALEGYKPILGGWDLLADGNMIKVKDIGKDVIDPNQTTSGGE